MTHNLKMPVIVGNQKQDMSFASAYSSVATVPTATLQELLVDWLKTQIPSLKATTIPICMQLVDATIVSLSVVFHVAPLMNKLPALIVYGLRLDTYVIVHGWVLLSPCVDVPIPPTTDKCDRLEVSVHNLELHVKMSRMSSEWAQCVRVIDKHYGLQSVPPCMPSQDISQGLYLLPAKRAKVTTQSLPSAAMALPQQQIVPYAALLTQLSHTWHAMRSAVSWKAMFFEVEPAHHIQHIHNGLCCPSNNSLQTVCSVVGLLLPRCNWSEIELYYVCNIVLPTPLAVLVDHWDATALSKPLWMPSWRVGAVHLVVRWLLTEVIPEFLHLLCVRFASALHDSGMARWALLWRLLYDKMGNLYEPAYTTRIAQMSASQQTLASIQLATVHVLQYTRPWVPLLNDLSKYLAVTLSYEYAHSKLTNRYPPIQPDLQPELIDDFAPACVRMLIDKLVETRHLKHDDMIALTTAVFGAAYRQTQNVNATVDMTYRWYLAHGVDLKDQNAPRAKGEPSFVYDTANLVRQMTKQLNSKGHPYETSCERRIMERTIVPRCPYAAAQTKDIEDLAVLYDTMQHQCLKAQSKHARILNTQKKPSTWWRATIRYSHSKRIIPAVDTTK